MSVLGGDTEDEAIFTRSLSPVSGQTVTVGYRTADETATEGLEYVGTSGTLTFAPGESQKAIAVTVVGDTALGNDGSFSVLLSNRGNAVIGGGWGTGTILPTAAPCVWIRSR